MDPRSAALAVAHARGVEQLVDAFAQTPTGIAAATAAAVAKQATLPPPVQIS